MPEANKTLISFNNFSGPVPDLKPKTKIRRLMLAIKNTIIKPAHLSQETTIEVNVSRPGRFRKISAKYGLEFLALILVLSSAYFAKTNAFTSLLVNENNSSGAFRFISANEHVNSRLVRIASLSQTKEYSLPQIFSVATAAEDNNMVLAEADVKVVKNTTPIVTSSEDSTIVKPNYAVAPGLQSENIISVYKVAAGDTPLTIASRFGLSVATLLVNNQLNDSSVIKPGQELKIPPVDGVTYKVKAGDTLAALATKYKVSEDDILNANEVETDEDLLIVDDEIVIPQTNLSVPKAPQVTRPRTQIVTNNTGRISLTTATAPSNIVSSGDLLWPTSSRTITQYFTRRHNGLDISGHKQNPGPDIYASDDGFVEIAGWQSGGWGNTVVINHGNGLKTRYAHMSVINISAGQSVTRGQQIGNIGNTGRSTGPHLHYTVYRNGIAVNPLSYIK